MKTGSFVIPESTHTKLRERGIHAAEGSICSWRSRAKPAIQITGEYGVSKHAVQNFADQFAKSRFCGMNSALQQHRSGLITAQIPLQP